MSRRSSSTRKGSASSRTSWTRSGSTSTRTSLSVTSSSRTLRMPSSSPLRSAIPLPPPPPPPRAFVPVLQTSSNHRARDCRSLSASWPIHLALSQTSHIYDGDVAWARSSAVDAPHRAVYLCVGCPPARPLPLLGGRRTAIGMLIGTVCPTVLTNPPTSSGARAERRRCQGTFPAGTGLRGRRRARESVPGRRQLYQARSQGTFMSVGMGAQPPPSTGNLHWDRNLGGCTLPRW